MNSRRFEGRRAVITGGASGIGLGVATRLAEEGARVALWDMSADALAAAEGAIGAGATGIQVDIADPDAVSLACRKSIEALGGIDILVTSAGITGPNTTTWEYPVDAWRHVIDVNLNGLFYCNRAVVPAMNEGGYGRNPNASAYSASKAAVIALTKSLGKELAKTNITVNCVTPAAVRTPIFDQMSQTHIDFMLSKIPMGRFGTIAEVTSLICWLASDECSFTTGGVFDISGGRATY
jgi:2-dehydro-3-deoxy-L-rhamnonate dehydrogenase (NAD+)